MASLLHRYCFGLFLFLFLTALSAFASESESPKELLSQFAQAHLAQSKGDSKTALNTLNTLQQKDPHSYHLASKISNAYWHNDKPRKASQTLHQFAKAHPQHLTAQLRYTNFLHAVSPRDETARQLAIDTLERAIQNHGLSPTLFSNLLNRYEQGEERPKSLDLYQKFSTQKKASSPDQSSQLDDPSHWQSLLNAARTLFPANSPEFQSANDRAHQNLHRTSLDNPDVARQISEYYRKKSNLPQAITTLQEHLDLTPSSHSLRTRLAILQLANKQPDDGESTLLLNLSIDPRQPLAHNTLAKHYQRNNQNEKRLYHRAQALRFGSGVPAEFLALANELLLTNNLTHTHNARLLLEKARFDHPSNLEILAQLAIATARDTTSPNHTLAASRLFRQAETLITELPSDEQDEARALLSSDFQLEFATLLLQSKSPQSIQLAETRLRQAIRSIPPDQPQKSARALASLAQLWLDQNKNHAAAHSLLRRAKQQDPENKDIDTLLQRCKK